MDQKPLTPRFHAADIEGKTHDRCAHCDVVVYRNPIPVGKSVSTFGGGILLVQRAIEPRKGYWDLPGGYIESGDTIEEGTIREAREEANATISLSSLLGIYDMPQAQSLIHIYRGHLASPEISPGVESQAVALFEWKDIPWNKLAFPVVEMALHYHKANLTEVNFQPERRKLAPLNQQHEFLRSRC